MTWFCRSCEVQNSQHLDKCRQCRAHWSEVWEPPKRKVRSRSKSRKYNKAEATGEQEQQATWQVFQEKVPWVQSTPARATSYRTDVTSDAKDKDLQLPPQPVLPPPPMPSMEREGGDALTTEEIKVLEHLRGLKGMNIALPEEMAQQLADLTVKEQRMATAKALTHGHINKFHKVKGQVAGAAKRIRELDAEWNAFMNRTMERVKEHGLLYQKCRADMMETYNQKLKELQTLKEEVSIASRSLVDQHTGDFDMDEMPGVADQMMKLQNALAENGTVDLTGDQMEDQLDEEELVAANMDQGEEEAKKDLPSALRPFRSAASPQQVAKTHLKAKQEKHQKDKDKEVRQKGDQ